MRYQITIAIEVPDELVELLRSLGVSVGLPPAADRRTAPAAPRPAERTYPSKGIDTRAGSTSTSTRTAPAIAAGEGSRPITGRQLYRLILDQDDARKLTAEARQHIARMGYVDRSRKPRRIVDLEPDQAENVRRKLFAVPPADWGGTRP
jgi:hypothetical protein